MYLQVSTLYFVRSGEQLQAHVRPVDGLVMNFFSKSPVSFRCSRRCGGRMSRSGTPARCWHRSGHSRSKSRSRRSSDGIQASCQVGHHLVLGIPGSAKPRSQLHLTMAQVTQHGAVSHEAWCYIVVSGLWHTVWPNCGCDVAVPFGFVRSRWKVRLRESAPFGHGNMLV